MQKYLPRGKLVCVVKNLYVIVESRVEMPIFDVKGFINNYF